MNISETIALIEALKASGVVKFKSNEHEIEFDQSKSFIKKEKPHEEADPKVVEAANEKIKSMLNTIQMSPEELANQIFPDGAL